MKTRRKNKDNDNEDNHNDDNDNEDNDNEDKKDNDKKDNDNKDNDNKDNYNKDINNEDINNEDNNKTKTKILGRQGSCDVFHDYQPCSLRIKENIITCDKFLGGKCVSFCFTL